MQIATFVDLDETALSQIDGGCCYSSCYYPCTPCKPVNPCVPSDWAAGNDSLAGNQGWNGGGAAKPVAPPPAHPKCR